MAPKIARKRAIDFYVVLMYNMRYTIPVYLEFVENISWHENSIVSFHSGLWKDLIPP